MAPNIDFSKQELQLLSGHFISPNEVYDGRDLPKCVIRDEMDAYGLRFYVGRFCTTGLHRIKTKAGHCIGCRRSSVAFQKRSADDGEVYLARCSKPGLVKIGSSTVGAARRIADLNAKQYGGRSDWKLVECFAVEAAGRLEFGVHRALARLDTSNQESPCIRQNREIFNCSVEQALGVLRTLASMAVAK